MRDEDPAMRDMPYNRTDELKNKKGGNKGTTIEED